ncbi:MAG: HlyD family secretion protein [Polyangiaceae bacterium]
MAQAEASLAQAQLAFDYTRVVADVAGTVARRTVEPGQLVSPDRPLLAIVPLDDTWIVANFKEDQLHKMHEGQRVDITVDTFEGEKFAGTVDSLAAGTGARFSLLPPDNASGNFTKVVQRVPVLIRLEAHPSVQLRPGMSAAVTVHVK